jgi:hypothetical protein
MIKEILHVVVRFCKRLRENLRERRDIGVIMIGEGLTFSDFTSEFVQPAPIMSFVTRLSATDLVQWHQKDRGGQATNQVGG